MTKRTPWLPVPLKRLMFRLRLMSHLLLCPWKELLMSEETHELHLSMEDLYLAFRVIAGSEPSPPLLPPSLEALQPPEWELLAGALARLMYEKDQSVLH